MGIDSGDTPENVPNLLMTGDKFSAVDPASVQKAKGVMPDPMSNIKSAMQKVAETMTATRSRAISQDDGPADKQVLIRATEADRDNWKAAADKVGVSMSEWIRDLLNDAAEKVLVCQHPVDQRLVYPWTEICTKCNKRLR